MDNKIWKDMLPDFRKATDKFYKGELKAAEYKGISGLYGSYAQKGGKSNMLRMRMSGGRITKDKMAYLVSSIRDHSIDLMHFTTCQAVQFHNLGPDTVCEVMEGGIDHDIITLGGGGDYPRNVMCSPLSGVETGENFDVMPYAQGAARFLMTLIREKKMPRKLKVCFSNSPENIPHATYRDLGFVSREDGLFDVYSAGGLGNNPRFGVKVAEGVNPEDILIYIKAMYLTFCKYGDYTNRGHARTRFMQEILGSPEAYIKAYNECAEELFSSPDRPGKLIIEGADSPYGNIVKTAELSSDGSVKVTLEALEKRGDNPDKPLDDHSGNIIPQRQPGLYCVRWHPTGGCPKPELFCELYDKIRDMEAVELRLAPNEEVYIINLTAGEAEDVAALLREDNSVTEFDRSVSCIGAAICQQGLRDSQALLRACKKAVSEAGIPDGALPAIHISGCPSSCGTHQTAPLSFRGATKKVDDEVKSAFLVYEGGCQLQGMETMGAEVGTLLQEDVPSFLCKLGNLVSKSGLTYGEWVRSNPDGVRNLVEEYA